MSEVNRNCPRYERRGSAKPNLLGRGGAGPPASRLVAQRETHQHVANSCIRFRARVHQEVVTRNLMEVSAELRGQQAGIDRQRHRVLQSLQDRYWCFHPADTSRAEIDAAQFIERVRGDNGTVADLLLHLRVVEVGLRCRLSHHPPHLGIIHIELAKGLDLANEMSSQREKDCPPVGELPMRGQEDELIGGEPDLSRQRQSNGATHRKTDQGGSLSTASQVTPRVPRGVQPLFGTHLPQTSAVWPEAWQQDAARGHAGRGKLLRQRSHVSRCAQKTVDQEGAGRSAVEVELAMIWMGVENVTHV